MASDPVLGVAGLEKSFGLRRNRIHALRGIDFTLMAGEAVALVGPNGAGKTTLLRMIVGLNRPTKGRLLLFDHSPTEPAARARVGYMPQAFRAYGFMTARQVLTLLGSLSGIPKVSMENEVRNQLERVGLADAVDRRVATFSGGMMRRLGLAQALIHRPDFLLLDEPSSGLDPGGRRLFARLLAAERARGATVLLSTHLVADAERSCERMLLLSSGSLVLDARIEELTGRSEAPPWPESHSRSLEDVVLEHLEGGLGSS
jgi:ABC-2 type transport system ATP-binding protein